MRFNTILEQEEKQMAKTKTLLENDVDTLAYAQAVEEITDRTDLALACADEYEVFIDDVENEDWFIQAVADKLIDAGLVAVNDDDAVEPPEEISDDDIIVPDAEDEIEI